MAPHTCRKEETLESLSKSLAKLWTYASRNRVLVLSPLAVTFIFLVMVTWSLTATANVRTALEQKCIQDAEKQTDVEVIKTKVGYIESDISEIKKILEEMRETKSK